MGIVRKSIIVLSILAGIFIIFPTIKASASGCLQSRFVIKDEVSGEDLGLIYSESAIARPEFCIEGEFLGIKYQYLYKCDNARGKFDFIKKFKTHQDNCYWGAIH